jgi:hypothetical protein
MAKYFITWNATMTEGFISDDKAGQDTAMTNKMDRSGGYPSRSTVAAAFFEAYEDEKKYRQTVDIEPPKPRNPDSSLTPP